MFCWNILYCFLAMISTVISQIAIQTKLTETMSYKLRLSCLRCSLSLVLLLLLQQNLNAQYAEVDQLVEQRKALYGGHVAVLAWKNDSLLYKKETGELNINSQEPVSAASGWFTAALVMTFVDQGKISLDDPVAKYLPIFRKYAKSYLTIRHCLSNTTGLEVEKGGLQKFFQKTKFASLEEEVDAFASKREIINNPGQEFYYSNIGLNIAGRVLEVVGKKSFDRLMTERIFRPLGMKKSTFTSEVVVNPYAGARSSAADYVKFLSMLLNKGTFSGKKILSESSVSELQKIQNAQLKAAPVPKAVEGYSYAFGTWVDNANGNGQPEVFISPGLYGSFAYMDVCRDYACVIIVKNQSKEDKRDFYVEVKEKLDGLVKRECR